MDKAHSSIIGGDGPELGRVMHVTTRSLREVYKVGTSSVGGTAMIKLPAKAGPRSMSILECPSVGSQDVYKPN